MCITCNITGNKKELLSSRVAACVYCFKQFPPGDIRQWCDNQTTAICPSCNVDAVVGFNGDVDVDFMQKSHKLIFGEMTKGSA